MFITLPWSGARPAASDTGGLTNTLIDGRYQLVECLERSATGQTWLARDRVADRQCGVKIALRADPDSGLQLLREGQLLEQIQHPHIVRLLDQLRMPGDGRPGLVLEWLAGEPLDMHLSRVGRLPAHRAIALISQLLLGLSALHTRGLVHRDLALPRLFLARDTHGEEVLKIIDLAHCAPCGTEPCASTFSGLTPTPESGPCDPRGDLYGVGLVFYELLSGLPPFAEDRLPAADAARWMHRHAQPQRPPGLTDRVWRILLNLLEKRPEDRYRSAMAVLNDLAQPTPSLPWGTVLNALEDGPSSIPEDRSAQAALVPTQVQRLRPFLEVAVEAMERSEPTPPPRTQPALRHPTYRDPSAFPIRVQKQRRWPIWVLAAATALAGAWLGWTTSM